MAQVLAIYGDRSSRVVVRVVVEVIQMMIRAFCTVRMLHVVRTARILEIGALVAVTQRVQAKAAVKKTLAHALIVETVVVAAVASESRCRLFLRIAQRRVMRQCRLNVVAHYEVGWRELFLAALRLRRRRRLLLYPLLLLAQVVQVAGRFQIHFFDYFGEKAIDHHRILGRRLNVRHGPFVGQREAFLRAHLAQMFAQIAFVGGQHDGHEVSAFDAHNLLPDQLNVLKALTTS